MQKKQIITALAAAGLLLQAPSANAEREGEISGFGGVHLFNKNNELGVQDQPDADSLKNAATFGVRVAYALYGKLDLEGELALSPTKSRSTKTDVVALGWRAHALLQFMDGDLHPFVLAGFGGMTSSSEDEKNIFSETDLLFHAGVGVKYNIQDNWGIRFDARLLLPPSSASSSVTLDSEFFLGLFKTFGDVSKPAPIVEPEPEPIPTPVADSDGDGVPDSTDKCPNEAEDMDGNEDSDGCPESEDSDGDGVMDKADMCPQKAEDKDGFEDGDGCPDPDNDKDGVLDGDDKCPAKLETPNGFEDSDGCPDEVPAAVKKFSGAIQGVKFKSASAKIRPVSFKVLKAAVKVFSEYPELKIEVQGHTDSTGNAEKNTELSQSRAQAVVDYLVEQGIAVERLVAKGYGPTVPVADNTTRKGQQENRRVEFKLIN